MSERAGVSWRGTAARRIATVAASCVAGAVWASAPAVTALTVRPTAVAAQASARPRITNADVAAIADSLAAIQMRAREARTAFETTYARTLETPDDSLTLSGATLLFRRDDLPPREITRLRTAFARVEMQVRQQFGDDGPRLLAETRWSIRVYRRPGVMEAPRVVFEPEVRRALAGAPVVQLPLDVDYVEELVRRGVGERIVLQNDALANWMGSAFSLDAPERSLYFASRDLVLHGNDLSRRCARGVVRDCGRILAPELYGTRREPGDDRRSNPATHTVRSSVLLYALGQGGGGAIAALAAAPDTNSAIAILAAIAETTPDGLIAGWHAQVAAAGTARTRVAPRMLLSSTAWILLFGLVATRRRPR